MRVPEKSGGALFFRPFEMPDGDKMIKNIVFDMGGVLIMYNPERTLRKYISDENDIELIMNEFYRKGAIKDTDRGVKTYEQIIGERRGALPEKLLALLKKLYVEQCYGTAEMPPFPEMYTLIENLRANGYRTYLLSNAGFDFYEFSPFIPAIGLMDGKVVSCEYKVLKPEREIYEILLDKYSLKASECVFIDDMEANIRGAENAGMNGICFSTEKEDMETLKEKLRKLKVKI